MFDRVDSQQSLSQRGLGRALNFESVAKCAADSAKGGGADRVTPMCENVLFLEVV